MAMRLTVYSISCDTVLWYSASEQWIWEVVLYCESWEYWKGVSKIGRLVAKANDASLKTTE